MTDTMKENCEMFTDLLKTAEKVAESWEAVQLENDEEPTRVKETVALLVAGMTEETKAQVLMEIFRGTGDNSELDKALLMQIAEWMGPEGAQTVYHASVFITKVA